MAGPRPRGRLALAWLPPALLCAVLAGTLAGCGSEEPPAPPAVPDAEVPALLETLTRGEAEAVRRAAERITDARDRRFVAPLVELLRASQIGVAGREGYEARVVALERLSGAALGADWTAWAAWMAEQEDLPLPPGFVGWKGGLLAALDPRYGEILTNAVPVRGRPELIDWGGTPVDGIPPLDLPDTVAAERAAELLEPDEPVAGLAIGDEARAYPFRVLDWHEVVNDRVGGRSVAITTGPLGGTAIAYDATLPEGGSRRMFSTSGLLYQSNKLLLDRRTRTLWTQLTGRPLLGPEAEAPAQPLEPLPLVVTTFARWRAWHPETRVLSLETGFERDYRPGRPYASYYASDRVLFPVATHREELGPKEHVFGIARGGEASAFPVETVAGARVWNTRAAGEPVVLISPGTALRVQHDHPDHGLLTYRAGASVRAYARGDHRFHATEGDGEAGSGEPAGARPPGASDGAAAQARPVASLRDEEGRPWRITEAALEGPEGARAPRVPGTLAYWFVWQAFHPGTELAEEAEEP